MAEAAQRSGVGPMAAVAGALAELAVADMLGAGAKLAVVEDGGEIAAHVSQPLNVGLIAGSTPLSRRLAFRIGPETSGVATSSGRYSHAFSFGDADAVTVFADGAALADAAATSVCNVVTGRDAEAAVRRGVERALTIEGVKGVLIIYDSVVGTGGSTPPTIPAS